eukprot:IDg9476t1
MFLSHLIILCFGFSLLIRLRLSALYFSHLISFCFACSLRFRSRCSVIFLLHSISLCFALSSLFQSRFSTLYFSHLISFASLAVCFLVETLCVVLHAFDRSLLRLQLSLSVKMLCDVSLALI